MRSFQYWLLASVTMVAVIGSVSTMVDAGEPKRLQLLLIDGQNNHDWMATSPVLREFLIQSGRFDVQLATSPPKGSPAEAWDVFRPAFDKFDVVLSNYNGELWPERVRKELEKYVSGGGGLVIVHAANNAFPQWPAWNEMIGLGWRDNKFGPRLTLDDNGQAIRTPAGEGPGAGHGPQHEFTVIVRDRQHPVMQGLPAEWMHNKDELYHGQRGPAANMHVLATAFSAPNQRGTGAHEPMVWWIPFGKGRVFTTVMGHADYSMRCIGFQTIVGRGAEWAATEKVTLPVPKTFPTAEKISVADAASQK